MTIFYGAVPLSKFPHLSILNCFCHFSLDTLPQFSLNILQHFNSVTWQLTKLTGYSTAVVFVTSEGSHETLQLPSRTVYSSTVLGVYKRSHTPLSLLQPSTDLVSVVGCLEWKLMTILRGFASQAGSVLSRGRGYPRDPPFIWGRQQFTIL